MGQSELFAENAEKLGIDLTTVDLAVLSHGHYDHGGGLARFLEINPYAPVYVTRNAFGCRWNGTGKAIGVELPVSGRERLRYVDDSCVPAPGMVLHTCNDRLPRWPAQAYGLTEERQGQRMPDAFRHEQYLLVEEQGKWICISGCSHKGIRNIVHWLKPDVLVGGFHLIKETDRETLEQVGKDLLDCSTVCYTGHCTGSEQFAVLKSILGDRLHRFSVGTEWII